MSALLFALVLSGSQDPSSPSTTLKSQDKCPPLVAEFTHGPWRGKTGDVLKANGPKPVVVLFVNPMQNDLDTMLVIGSTMDKSREKFSEQGLSVAIVGFYMGLPSGQGSQSWLKDQFRSLAAALGSESMNLGIAPIGSDLRKGFKLRDGFKNAAFVVRDGTVQGVCDNLSDKEADQKQLTSTIEKALGG